MMEFLIALLFVGIVMNVLNTVFILRRIIDAEYFLWLQHKELKEKIDNKKDRCVCPICLKEFRRG